MALYTSFFLEPLATLNPPTDRFELSDNGSEIESLTVVARPTAMSLPANLPWNH